MAGSIVGVVVVIAVMPLPWPACLGRPITAVHLCRRWYDQFLSPGIQRKKHQALATQGL
jgi:hypothetical protein